MQSEVNRQGVSMVLPVHNERENLEDLVNAVITVFKNRFERYEVIIVDDGSRDGSAEVMDRLAKTNESIRIVRHPKNLGYGMALRSGFKKASLDLILYLDTDGQFDVSEICSIFSWCNDFDIVVGYRMKRMDSLYRRFLGKVWNLLLRWLFKLNFKDINCGVKLFKSSVVKQMILHSRGGVISAEMLLKAQGYNVSIKEIGLPHHLRITGRPKGSSLKTITIALCELTRLYLWSMFKMRQNLVNDREVSQ